MKFALYFLSLSLVPAVLCCQDEPDEPQAGFLNILNLITLSSPTFITFDSFKLNSGAEIKSGESSGILAVKPGTYTLSLVNDGARPKHLSGEFTVENGKSVAIICYDEVEENRDGKQDEKLRYNVLVEGDPPTGPRFSLISLLKKPMVGIEISGVSVTLFQKKVHPAKVSLKRNISIVHKGRSLAEFQIEKPIHYIGFLFQNPETDQVEISLIESEKLEYQAPLGTDADDVADDD